MPTSVLSVPVPVITDDPNVPRDMLAQTQALLRMVTPEFATTGERDTAYASYPFRQCYVAGRRWERVGSLWVPRFTVRLDASRNDNFNVTSSADPGVLVPLDTMVQRNPDTPTWGDFSGRMIRVPYSGLYSIHARGNFAPEAGGTGRRTIRVAIGNPANGSMTTSIDAQVDAAIAGYSQTVRLSTEEDLTAGTWIALYMAQNSGTTLVGSYARLKVRLIDAAVA